MIVGIGMGRAPRVTLTVHGTGTRSRSNEAQAVKKPGECKAPTLWANPETLKP